MLSEQTTMWGIHAGSQGEADSLFLEGNCIAIGWKKCGDLSNLHAEREAFKKKVAKGYPECKPGAIPVYGGLLFRFCHEMQVGDLVAYPSKIDKQIHLGRVTGEYKYDSSHTHPNIRSVEWVRSVPRTTFSQGALYEIGSAVTLFQLKNYLEEYLAAYEGRAVTNTTETTGADVTVGLVAEEVEQTTRDFIVKQLLKELKGHPFAQFVASLLNLMGYHTRVSPPGPDKGVDIIAHKDELGFQPPIIKVQVKSTEGSVGDPETSALYGKVAQGEFGLLVTLGSFTKAATQFAETKSNLRLMDGEEVVSLTLRYYEQIDSKYKGILPLKLVYIPQTIEEGSDEE